MSYSSAVSPMTPPPPSSHVGGSDHADRGMQNDNAAVRDALRRHLSHKNELYVPQPTSMLLSAALLLLDSPLLVSSSSAPDTASVQHDNQRRNSALSGSGATWAGGSHRSSPTGNSILAAENGNGNPKGNPNGNAVKPESHLDQSVYLVPIPYLQRWVHWAYAQPVPAQSNEVGRMRLALCMACELYGLELPPGATDTAQAAAASDANDHHLGGVMENLSLLDTDNEHDDEDEHGIIADERKIAAVPSAASAASASASFHPAPPPGPIDCRSLSVPNHPHMLRSDVVLLPVGGVGGYVNPNAMGGGGDGPLAVPVPERFYELLRSTHGVLTNDVVAGSGVPNKTGKVRKRAAVSFQRPYGLVGGGSIGGISSSHGATGGTAADYDGIIMHHHVFADEGDPPGPRRTCAGGNQCEVCNLVTREASASDMKRTDQLPPQPVEFRRRVIRGNNTITSSTTSRSSPRSTHIAAPPAVEVHPIRISYTIVSPESQLSPHEPEESPSAHGFVLISSQVPAHAALRLVLRSALPAKSTQCKRIWYPSYGNSSRHSKGGRDDESNADGNGQSSSTGVFPTRNGNGYDVLDLDAMIPLPSTPAKSQTNTAALATRAVTSGRTNGAVAAASAAAAAAATQLPSESLSQWMRLRTTCSDSASPSSSSPTTIHLLIETRPAPKTQEEANVWPRTELELSHRLVPGDFVDAQDNTRTWYEAQIREVHGDKVKVHYFGWASRWDGWIRRYPAEKDVSGKETSTMPKGCMRGVSAPAPLHSRTQPWRGLVKVGDEIEVRDVSSLPSRPKWFRGVVSYVAPVNVISEIEGGAELVQFDVLNADGSKSEETRPLLLLDRTQQILVEVEQELQNQNNPTQPIIPVPSMEDASRGILPTAQPPHVRWMSLYGEELCRLGTHIKSQPKTKGSKPATITYAHDRNKPPVTVLGSFNDTHGQGFVRESIKGRPPAPGCVGLQNLGNSCFMNSIVQCMNQIDFLTRYFLKGDWKKEINRANPLGKDGIVASAYASLLADIWSNDYSALAPRTLKKTIGLFAPQFNNIHQHDSEEFHGFFLDGIHEDLNRVYNKPYVETLECFGMPDDKAALETWRRHLLRHDSVIVDKFQGMYRSHVTCPKCGRESVRFDVFSSLQLPLVLNKDGGPILLEDCLEQLVMGEQLDEDNAYYCSSCEEHVCALKMIALWSVPDVLVLSLKRFGVKNCDVRGGFVRTKLEDVVAFPVDTLDLRDHVIGQYDPEAPPVYKLFGVSEHTGTTVDSGHYTATVLNSINKQWYRFNDSHVGASTGDASVTGGAYLLFYQRKTGSSRWGGMERIMTKAKIDPHGALETDVDGFTHVTNKKKKKRGAGGGGSTRFAC